MSTNSYTKTRFSAKDTALVLIDHQSGIMQLVHDYSPAELRNNVMALAKRCNGMQGNSLCVRRNGCRGTTARRWRMHHLRDKIMHGRKRSYAAV